RRIRLRVDALPWTEADVRDGRGAAGCAAPGGDDPDLACLHRPAHQRDVPGALAGAHRLWSVSSGLSALQLHQPIAARHLGGGVCVDAGATDSFLLAPALLRAWPAGRLGERIIEKSEIRSQKSAFLPGFDL